MSTIVGAVADTCTRRGLNCRGDIGVNAITRLAGTSRPEFMAWSRHPHGAMVVCAVTYRIVAGILSLAVLHVSHGVMRVVVVRILRLHRKLCPSRTVDISRRRSWCRVGCGVGCRVRCRIGSGVGCRCCSATFAALVSITTLVRAAVATAILIIRVTILLAVIIVVRAS